jgi:RNA polymerase II subunit A C-terminal domain phosphatase SSU72
VKSAALMLCVKVRSRHRPAGKRLTRKHFPDLLNRGGQFNKLVHVINLKIKDNHEEAFLAGKAILDLAKAVSIHSVLTLFLSFSPPFLQIENAADLDVEMEDILLRQQDLHPHELLHTISFY